MVLQVFHLADETIWRLWRQSNFMNNELNTIYTPNFKTVEEAYCFQLVFPSFHLYVHPSVTLFTPPQGSTVSMFL